jgi:hypothetical protein
LTSAALGAFAAGLRRLADSDATPVAAGDPVRANSSLGADTRRILEKGLTAIARLGAHRGPRAAYTDLARDSRAWS